MKSSSFAKTCGKTFGNTRIEEIDFGAGHQVSEIRIFSILSALALSNDSIAFLFAKETWYGRKLETLAGVK